MAERQITVGSVTYPLPKLFLVMATQNPIEQEGTYPLPEAQLDRFLMHVQIGYPDAQAEKSILRMARGEAHQQIISSKVQPVTQEALFAARDQVLDIHMAENVESYLLEIVLATRQSQTYSPELANWIQYGASPRATIALDRCARAHAWLAGRDFVSPEDIQSMAFDVLRHRIILSYEAEADGITADRFISDLIQRIPVP
jgi:MoxR-like ATPase